MAASKADGQVQRAALTPNPTSPGTASQAVPPPTPTPLLDDAKQRVAVLQQAAIDEPEPIAAVGPNPTASATPALADPLVPIKPKPAAEPKPIDPELPVVAAPPRDDWRDGLERLRTLAHNRVEETEGNAAGTWQVRSRLLDGLSRIQDDAPAKPLWETVLTALAALEVTEPTDPKNRAAEIRAAVEALEDQAPLEIIDLRLCRKVNGFGNFEPLDESDCKAGRSVIVYCLMSGLRYESTSDGFRSRLSSQVELVDTKGGEPIWKPPLGTAEDLCQRRRRDYYVNCRIALPETLAAGTYELRVTQRDLIANRAATLSIPLVIQP